MSIDGDVPDAAYEEIVFEPTGGYGRAEKEWRVARLGPPIDLCAAEHTLRMTNLGGGLAREYLALVPVDRGED